MQLAAAQNVVEKKAGENRDIKSLQNRRGKRLALCHDPGDIYGFP